MKKKLLIIATIFATQYSVFSQTVLWSENFESYAPATGFRGTLYTNQGDYPSNTAFSINADNLTLSDINDFIRVNAGILKVRDIDGEGLVTFKSLDISSQTGDVTINIGQMDFDITSSGSTWTGGEYMDVEYSLDGGTTFVLVPNYNGRGSAIHTLVCPTGLGAGVDFNNTFSTTLDPGGATTLILRLKVNNDGANEQFKIDNINILRNSASLFTEDFQSCVENTGVDGVNSEKYDKIGDYATVTKWALTLTDDLQLLDNDDYARTTANSVNGSLVFKLQDVNKPVTFQTEAIDITGQSQVTFGLDLFFDTIGATSSGYETTDFLDIYYSLNGGGTFLLAKNNGANHTFSGTAGGIGSNPSAAGGILSASGTTPQSLTETVNVNFSQTLNSLTASSLIIKLVLSNDDAGSEDYEFDNMKVVSGATLSAPTYTSETGLKIYPNPVSNGVLNIVTDLQNEKHIAIYDMLGRRVLETKTLNSQINVSTLNPGLYIINIDGKAAKKLIIN